MPGVVTNYRLAKEGDIPNMSTVFAEAHDDLYRKRGFFETPTNLVPANPLLDFLIRKVPHAVWVAEEEGEVVGFTGSFVRGSLWFLSYLFVAPAFQGQGIGRSLLERTLVSWKDTQITNRATITLAFNPASQSLFMECGMYPREPAYFAEGSSSTIMESWPPAHELDFEALTSLRDGSEILRHLDELVLGFSLDWHHEFFFETRARCYIFKDKGNLVGYAYVRPSGGVGPIVVNSSRFTRPVLQTALGLSAGQEVEKVWYYMPGSNVYAVELALKYKMRLDPYLFMSAKPFGKWENYIFHRPGLM